MSALGCQVLVLNKHYMAVRVVNVKRAISLLFKDLAEVVDCEQGQYYNYNFENWLEVSELKLRFEPSDNDWLHTVKLSIAVPRVVRLLFYDRFHRQTVTLNRRNIFARDRSRCQYCGKHLPTSELSLDHIVPRSLGGQASWENLVCACVKCNVKKGGRPPREAGMCLINHPVKPSSAPVINININEGRYRSWKQFLDHAYWSVELK
jgi:5-methylcytosine-specific restriction endonuclease McrA